MAGNDKKHARAKNMCEARPVITCLAITRYKIHARAKDMFYDRRIQQKGDRLVMEHKDMPCAWDMCFDRMTRGGRYDKRWKRKTHSEVARHCQRLNNSV